ncbi:alpha/beta hydrolase [Photobacterium sp. OFAV2-7]|uniref:alpha/beta hydrolase n=1 Tax=Photobacterium sp. OFAV2-7 TaxID=2917748 RepID=UPI001EF604C5|nr:alpha/beta hydrolase [Photobacterium sp. OFAV2-7]MCG7588608.1 alpha/beta hydrolase [Photobacterium sp. OFAV2-7]
MFKKLLMLLLGALPLVACSSYANQPLKENTMQTIELDTRVGPLAANLYLPEGIENPPVVIVTGAWTTVKEQMPAVYAEALAKKGYAAVTFDFRGWGQSDGEAHYLEDPSRKTQDIRAVIDAVAKLEHVDGSRIAGLGVCASSGYMLDAAVDNDNIQAVALVAPWLHDKAMATAVYGGEESVKGLLAAAEQAKNASEPVYIEAASTTNENSLMYQVPYYTETDRGLIPEYDNQFNVASWSGWLNYDAQQSAYTLDKPVLMVASESMALPAGAHQYLENAGENVSSIWLDGVSQFDFYDQPEPVSQAVAAVSNYFDANL